MRIRTLFLFFISTTTLAAVNQTIPTVVVKPKKIHAFSSGPTIIIDQSQIAATGVTSLSQVLATLGGVTLSDTTGNGSQTAMSLRGFGANASSNTLLLINGIPITNPDLAPPNLNTIPLDEIQAILVTSGSESVLYGDQAVGGIINLITKDASKEPANISCSGGSYHAARCYVGVQHQYQDWYSHVAASRQQTDNYRAHNSYEQDLLTGNFKYRDRFHFDFTLADEDMQYPGALTAQQVRQNRRQSTNQTDFFKDNDSTFHFNYLYPYNENWNITTDLSRRDMSGHGVLFSPFTQSRHSTFLKPIVNGKIGNATVESGIDFQSDKYELTSAYGKTANTQEKYGLFGLINIPLNEKQRVSIGARGAEQQNHLQATTDSNPIHRAVATTLGTTYQLTSDTQFYLRRAESFRFPNADEMAFIPSNVNELKTQRGVSYETGVELQRENSTFKLGLYQLNLRDEIALDPTQTPQQPLGANRNLDPTIRRGFTLSGKYDLNDSLAIDGQYNYVNARFQNGVNKGNRIPLVSTNFFRGGINYQFAENWHLYPEIVFTGSQMAENDDANVAGTLGGYTQYNLNLHYQRKSFSADLRLNNITNKYYYFYTVYQPSMLTEFFYPAPERNVTLNINYAFA